MTEVPPRIDGVTWLVAALIALTLTFAGAAIWLAIQRDQARDQLEQLRTQVATACGGTIAALDLTDWVQVCRHPDP